MSVPYLEALY